MQSKSKKASKPIKEIVTPGSSPSDVFPESGSFSCFLIFINPYENTVPGLAANKYRLSLLFGCKTIAEFNVDKKCHD